MTLRFWDRDNQPLPDVLAWARLFDDPGYRRVAYDVEGDHAVSTIWQGVDLAHRATATTETAMIFETAYLTGDVVVDSALWRTERGARAGHHMMCVKLLGRLPAGMTGFGE